MRLQHQLQISVAVLRKGELQAVEPLAADISMAGWAAEALLYKAALQCFALPPLSNP